MSTSHIVTLLIEERDRLEAVISILQGTTPAVSKKRPGRPPAQKAAQVDDPTMPDWVKSKALAKKKRKMSAEGRQRIIDATKARWARIHAEKAAAAGPKGKRAILAAVTPSAEDAEFKSKMSIAMKKAWAKRRKKSAKKG